MDYKEAVKKYWPWILGGVGGLYLITKFSGGSSSSSTADYLNAQNSAALGQQQIAAQKEIELAKVSASTAATNATIALQTAQFEAQRDVAYIQAQASMAQAVGTSASGLATALYAPGIAAITAAGAENAMALQAAATVAAAGFNTQASMVDSTTGAVMAGADTVNAWSGVLQGLGTMLANQGAPAETAFRYN